MSIRVLLADDHAVMREGLRLLLEADSGISVVSAVANGRDALRAAQQFTPDVVVMDVSMPELNGIEATRLIREKCPQVQVVILSMHSTREHVFQAFAAGATGYVLKDSAAAEVLVAVRSARNGIRYVSPAVDRTPDDFHRGDKAGPLASLSAREREVLQLVVEGKSSAEIGKIVHLSPKTVETYRSRLMKKLGVANVAALVKFALEHGITPPG